MSRKVNIKISDGKEFEVEQEGLSFKKVMKSVEGNAPKGTRLLRVQYTNRKGTEIDRWQKIPMRKNSR
tara:strand:+ start:711 stop:914 length:204 start_codon:yes stop_codon:yes gene_type:complete